MGSASTVVQVTLKINYLLKKVTVFQGEIKQEGANKIRGEFPSRSSPFSHTHDKTQTRTYTHRTCKRLMIIMTQTYSSLHKASVAPSSICIADTVTRDQGLRRTCSELEAKLDRHSYTGST